jgi:RNA polymerase sigma factor (sigma-70 family)
MSTAHSVSQWIANLKEQDSDAAQRLWERYVARLVRLARRRLKDSPKRIADEEDVAVSVFHSLCRGAAAGRFQNVENRDDLWWLLLAITRQKVASHVRRETAQKRGANRIHSADRFTSVPGNPRAFELDRLISDEPRPEFVLMLEEEHERLLAMLRDDRLRQIALFRIEGYTVPEIAENLGVSTRSIERKLQLIRSVWSKELDT